MLSVVVYLWVDEGRDFKPEYINIQARNIRRNLSTPHRFICVTDFTEGFDAGVTVIKTPASCAGVAELRSPEGARFPSCYRRLWTFSREARYLLGDRVLLLDADAMALDELAPLVDRKETFVGWRPRAKWGRMADRIGGGMWLLTTGSHEGVWSKFKGATSVAEARAAGYRGSDQAWLSYCLGRTCVVWPDNAGLYSIRDFRDGTGPVPPDARLVQFNGPPRLKPWNIGLPWVQKHWR